MAYARHNAFGDTMTRKPDEKRRAFFAVLIGIAGEVS